MRFSKILNRLSQIVIPPDFLGRFKILRKAAAFFAQAELDRKFEAAYYRQKDGLDKAA